jgi:hypothetical protein
MPNIDRNPARTRSALDAAADAFLPMLKRMPQLAVNTRIGRRSEAVL